MKNYLENTLLVVIENCQKIFFFNKNNYMKRRIM